MKAVPVALIAIFLAGCSGMRPNPAFSTCSNHCTKKHDGCMVNASTADHVARCGSGLDGCIEACEAKNPRWINP